MALMESNGRVRDPALGAEATPHGGAQRKGPLSFSQIDNSQIVT